MSPSCCMLMICFTLFGIEEVLAGVQHPVENHVKKRYNHIDKSSSNFEVKTQCYDDIGCLNITSSWYHPKNRPINAFPSSRSDINTRFILYTRKNPTTGHFLEVSEKKAVPKSNFKAAKLTKIILHGFYDNGESDWVVRMKDKLIKNGDYNVVVVDWINDINPMYYTRACHKSRLIGLEIAYFVNQLQKKINLDPGDVHIIAHSLGAHIASYAGERIKGLGRITGLDPSLTNFEDMPTEVRLDPTDANFVDVIHTDIEPMNEVVGWGLAIPMGHLDFYPNGGVGQPGCALFSMTSFMAILRSASVDEASRVPVSCSHMRAVQYFTESINRRCPYLGYNCLSYKSFLAGNCTRCSSIHACAYMGFYAQKPHKDYRNTKFFLLTGTEPPFCQHHYRITLYLWKVENAEQFITGKLTATITSKDGINIEEMNLTPFNYASMQHGTNHTMVVGHHRQLCDRVKKVELTWRYVRNQISNCGYLCNRRLYIRSIKVIEMDHHWPEMESKQQTERGLCKIKRQFAVVESGGNVTFERICPYMKPSV